MKEPVPIALAFAFEQARLPLVRALERRGLSRDRAEDVAQDAMLRALERAATFRPGARVLPWLLAVAMNLHRDQARRTRPVVALGETAAPGPAHDLALEAEIVRRAFRRLSEAERRVTSLFYDEGQDIAAIAAALGMPAGTVKSHLHRAREVLARALQADERGDHR